MPKFFYFPNPKDFALSVLVRLVYRFPKLFLKFNFRRNGYRVILSNNWISVNSFVYGNRFLSADENFLRQIVNKNDFFVDVGANIGLISLGLVTHASARGVAIEANPKTFHNLQKNIKINNLESSINALNYAIGDVDHASLEIQDSLSDDCNSIIDNCSPNQFDGSLFRVGHTKTYSVMSRTLDSIAVEHRFPNYIRLLKIDVEGYELFVLRGATSLLKNTEIVYVEYWDKLTQKYGYDQTQLFSLLEQSGFKLYYLPDFKSIREESSFSLKPLLKDMRFETKIDLIGVSTLLNVGRLSPFLSDS